MCMLKTVRPVISYGLRVRQHCVVKTKASISNLLCCRIDVQELLHARSFSVLNNRHLEIKKDGTNIRFIFERVPVIQFNLKIVSSDSAATSVPCDLLLSD